MEGFEGRDDPDENDAIERAAYAAIGHVDARPKNAPEASRVIRRFVIGELDAAGYKIVRK